MGIFTGRNSNKKPVEYSQRTEYLLLTYFRALFFIIPIYSVILALFFMDEFRNNTIMLAAVELLLLFQMRTAYYTGKHYAVLFQAKLLRFFCMFVLVVLVKNPNRWLRASLGMNLMFLLPFAQGMKGLCSSKIAHTDAAKSVNGNPSILDKLD
ncbi:hypothetical protein PCE1_000693 [Barthelona sp. PCE]